MKLYVHNIRHSQLPSVLLFIHRILQVINPSTHHYLSNDISQAKCERSRLEFSCTPTSTQEYTPSQKCPMWPCTAIIALVFDLVVVELSLCNRLKATSFGLVDFFPISLVTVLQAEWVLSTGSLVAKLLTRRASRNSLRCNGQGQLFNGLKIDHKCIRTCKRYIGQEGQGRCILSGYDGLLFLPYCTNL